MESFALIALFLTVLGYALRLREKPAHEGGSINLAAGRIGCDGRYDYAALLEMIKVRLGGQSNRP